MILHINCCIRKNSRTNFLANALIEKINNKDIVTETKLCNEKLLPLNEKSLNYRSELIEKGQYNDSIFDYAKNFANADIIVISAPFWDLSFPALLKIYFENIYVTGIVSKYDGNGQPKGLCKAKKLYYVTTAGGLYCPKYSFGYIKELSIKYFGIKEVKLIMAEMLDIEGNNPQDILDNAIKDLNKNI